jgi:hypothetical protein
MTRPTRLICLATLILATTGGGARAQLAILAQRQACLPSARILCPSEVAAHDRLAVRACLLKHFDKVAPDCQTTIRAAQAAASKP